MSDIVWAINPGNDRFENILSRMQAFAAEILEKTACYTWRLTQNCII